ncbi:MAG: HD domain-containing protein, partial [Candidatus Anstonellales archaeon]
RLRLIKQLSMAYLVYPGANHTRFEHSIGTAYISGAIAEKLGMDVEKARVYGLLHDIGHVAFSHSGEEVLNKLGISKNHEEFGEAFVDEALKGTSFTRKEIERAKEKKIISFSLGSDRLDYLRRDAYYCGVYFGYVDYEHLLTNLEYKNGTILVRESGLSNVEMLFIARYLMFFTVYLHRTVRIADAMLKRALMEALKKGIISIDDLIWKGDNFCLNKMAKHISTANNLLLRKLYKEVDKNTINKMNKNEYMIIKPGRVLKKEDPVLIKLRNGKIMEINEISSLIANLSKSVKLRSRTIIAQRID